MKMMFFKVRAISILIMLTIFATCGVLVQAPTSVPAVQQEQPVVVIYSTEWCKYCTIAKAFMKENNIKFVEKDPRNAKHFKELTDLAKKIGISTNSLNVVPIFIIRNKIIIGYNPEEILCLLSGKACSTDFLRVREAF